MDHSLDCSAAQRRHLADNTSRAVATLKTTGCIALSNDETDLSSAESICQGRDCPTSFLQRLLECDREFWLGRTTHDRLRSSGRSNLFLHFAGGVRRVVASDWRARCRHRMAQQE